MRSLVAASILATGVRNGQQVSIPFSRWLQHIGTRGHLITRTYMLSIPTILKKELTA